MSDTMKRESRGFSGSADRVVEVIINPSRIGVVIGAGGKTIKAITAETNTKVDIEQDGIARISGGPEADIDGAVHWIKTLAGAVDVNAIYEGKVRRTTDFGIFVELVPGMDGLVHVSNIAEAEKSGFPQGFAYDDLVQVQVLDHDESRGRIGLKLLKRL